MRGFSDIRDDDLLSLDEIAARFGFSRASSLSRWLAGRMLQTPPRLRPGCYRGADVKAWFGALPSDSVQGGALSTGAPARSSSQARPGAPLYGNVVDFAARMRASRAAAG